MKIAFVTHYCTHYRIRTYETLARYEDVTYFFYSSGKEWYWDQFHGVSRGKFYYKYLSGFQIGRTRIAPTLGWHLWRGGYDIYLKCINGKFALPLTYAIARLRRKPFVLWASVWMRLETPAHRLIWPLTRHIYQNADSIVTYGSHVKEFLIREGVPPERIFPARHAINNDEFNGLVDEADCDAVRQKLGIRKNQKIVLFVGRLVEIKGLPYLLEAFAQVADPDAVLVLVGRGPLEAALHEQANTLGIADKVRFAGYVPTNKTVPYYAVAWIHVLPSITTPLGRETWGLVVNEAFNQGIPSIATDAVGAAAGGLVQDGLTGFIVPEQDSLALAKRLQQILADPELRCTLGENARREIRRWDNEAMVASFRDALQYAFEQTKTGER